MGSLKSHFELSVSFPVAYLWIFCVLQFAPSLSVSEDKQFVEKIQNSCNFAAGHILFKHISPLVYPPLSVLAACSYSFLLNRLLNISVLSHIHTPPLILASFSFFSSAPLLPVSFTCPRRTILFSAKLVTTTPLHYSFAFLTPLFP